MSELFEFKNEEEEKKSFEKCCKKTSEILIYFFLQNRVNPGHETREFGRVPFKATFTKKKGASDGFKMDSTPLFKVHRN